MLEATREQMQELTKLVANLQKSYEDALLKAKQLQDPAKYEELKEQAFTNFIANLDILKLKFT